MNSEMDPFKVTMLPNPILFIADLLAALDSAYHHLPPPGPPFWNTFYSGLPWQCSLPEFVLWYWLLSLGLFCGPWIPHSQMLFFPELYLGTVTISLLQPHALPGWSYLLLWPYVSSECHCLYIYSPYLPHWTQALTIQLSVFCSWITIGHLKRNNLKTSLESLTFGLYLVCLS